MMTCKTYHGINNHVLFFKDLDHGMTIYHLIMLAMGLCLYILLFSFQPKIAQLNLSSNYTLHMKFNLYTEGFNFLICSLFVNEYFITCIPIIWRLEAFQFKVCVDSDLVSQCHVLHSISCLHQLLKAQELGGRGCNSQILYVLHCIKQDSAKNVSFKSVKSPL